MSYAEQSGLGIISLKLNPAVVECFESYPLDDVPADWIKYCTYMQEPGFAKCMAGSGHPAWIKYCIKSRDRAMAMAKNGPPPTEESAPLPSEKSGSLPLVLGAVLLVVGVGYVVSRRLR